MLSYYKEELQRSFISYSVGLQSAFVRASGSFGITRDWRIAPRPHPCKLIKQNPYWLPSAQTGGSQWSLDPWLSVFHPALYISASTKGRTLKRTVRVWLFQYPQQIIYCSHFYTVLPLRCSWWCIWFLLSFGLCNSLVRYGWGQENPRSFMPKRGFEPTPKPQHHHGSNYAM